MTPEFAYGSEVRVLRNLRNDGTYPGFEKGSLLVRRGSIGFVRDVGTFLQDQVIYAVHFLAEEKLVGCRESELQSADAPWIDTCFEIRDKVATRVPLGVRGRVIVQQGEVGQIFKVLRDSPEGVCYQVQFEGRNILQVPETALELPEG